MGCGCKQTFNVERVNEFAPPNIVQGVKGLTSSVLGIGLAEQSIIDERRNVCRDCEHATRNPNKVHLPTKGLTTWSRCQICTCLIAHKTRLQNESCPKGKW